MRKLINRVKQYLTDELAPYVVVYAHNQEVSVVARCWSRKEALEWVAAANTRIMGGYAAVFHGWFSQKMIAAQWVRP